MNQISNQYLKLFQSNRAHKTDRQTEFFLLNLDFSYLFEKKKKITSTILPLHHVNVELIIVCHQKTKNIDIIRNILICIQHVLLPHPHGGLELQYR